MKINWNNFSAVASLALLAACGGSSGNAALSKTFTYGAAQSPSTSEQSGADNAQSSLSATSGFSSSPDAAKGAVIVSFADALASAALGSSGFSAPHPGRPDIERALRTADSSNCTTVSGNSVVFANCSQKEGDFTITLNGSITSNAGTVSWSITGGFSGSSNGSSATINIHQTGTMTVTSSKINGNATSDTSGNISAQGQNVSFGVATAALVDLTYQSTPNYCINSGTLEVKRVWTQKPNGASGPQFADVGVKMSWSGCNAVQVAHSQ